MHTCVSSRLRNCTARPRTRSEVAGSRSSAHTCGCRARVQGVLGAARRTARGWWHPDEWAAAAPARPRACTTAAATATPALPTPAHPPPAPALPSHHHSHLQHALLLHKRQERGRAAQLQSQQRIQAAGRQRRRRARQLHQEQRQQAGGQRGLPRLRGQQAGQLKHVRHAGQLSCSDAAIRQRGCGRRAGRADCRCCCARRGTAPRRCRRACGSEAPGRRLAQPHGDPTQQLRPDAAQGGQHGGRARRVGQCSIQAGC